MRETIRVESPHKKDLALKLLLRHNDVFAGILNSIAFGGQPVIRPEELFDAHSVTSYNTENYLHGLYRDVTKIWKKDQLKLCIIGCEGQLKPEKRMIFRTVGYDGADYRDQAEEAEDPVPVMTFVLYFGDPPWNAPTSLQEALHIPEGLEPYFSDYHMNVIDILHMSEEDAEIFKGNFGFLLNGIRNLKRRIFDDKKQYYLRHTREVLQAVNEFGIRIFVNALQSERKEGYYTMYHLLSEEEQARYEAIGQAKGETDGKVKNAASNILALMRNLNVTTDKAMELLDLSEEEKKAALEQIHNMS